METINFNEMNWKQRIDHFKEIGLWQTFLISKNNEHPLYMDANDYFDENNE